MKRPSVGTNDIPYVDTINYPVTDDQRHRAARYVAGHAHDVDDARNLLDALGLLGGDDAH